jgi:hypothetical protein
MIKKGKLNFHCFPSDSNRFPNGDDDGVPGDRDESDEKTFPPSKPARSQSAHQTFD